MNSIQKKSIIQKVFDWFFYVLLLVIMIVFLGLSVFQSQDKSFLGYRMFGVLSNSMTMPSGKTENGGFKSGSVIFVKEVQANQLKIGDIITYRPSINPNNTSTNFLTHRLVEIQEDVDDGPFYVTKGDGNKDNDMPIVSKAIVGKVVFSIPMLGNILKFIKENKITSVILLASIIAFFWTLKMYVLPSKNEKNINVRDSNTSRKKSNSQQSINGSRRKAKKKSESVRRRRKKATNQEKKRSKSKEGY